MIWLFLSSSYFLNVFFFEEQKGIGISLNSIRNTFVDSVQFITLQNDNRIWEVIQIQKHLNLSPHFYDSFN